MNALPRLHVLTDQRSDADLLAFVEAVLDAGAPCIQLRSKDRDDAALYALAVEVVSRCRLAGATCLVNDRADIAVAAGADGVHVGARDLPVAAVRGIVGEHLLVGATARAADQGARAAAEGADYLGVGPVFATTTKTGLPDPIGPSGLAAVTAAVEIPVLGIAGVTADRVDDVLATGAHGVAVTSAVTMADDPAAAVRRLLVAIGGAP